MFNKKDIKLFNSKGITPEQVEDQLENFRNGFPFIQLHEPAIPGNGIIQLSESDVDRFGQLYEECLDQNEVIKFVPASGAATRMFKDLFAYLEKAEEEEDEAKLLEQFNQVNNLLESAGSLPFINKLRDIFSEGGQNLDTLIGQGQASTIVNKILSRPGLGYGELPKGLILFHAYSDHSRTSFEEHLVEGAQYARSDDSTVRLHFTVSPEHMDSFRKRFDEVRTTYEDHFKVRYSIEFSIQQPSTDTIAVDMDNKPFRDADGNIVFRPGGHGALLENLNGLDEDLIFVKNIDNIAPDRIKPITIRYKKALAGLLIDFQDKVFTALKDIESDDITLERLQEICDFIGANLCKMDKNVDPDSPGKIRSALKTLLNRPIRVAGMVKNEGEPGGGPFWVRQPDGRIDLQIVEASQVSPDQTDLLKQSTHFNPVDLVCAVKDYNGDTFDLVKFRDPQTGFITEKSISGQPVKAQELPGLWNGSMADWNTIFVEVPIDTFTPVKTIFDLLREEHLQKDN
jgi:hypothetical protein